MNVLEGEKRMSFKYYVECWIYPKSGYDIIRKNKIITLFKEVLLQVMPEETKKEINIDDLIEKFCEKHNEMVLEPLVLESDTDVLDPEKELMPEIWKKYPEAKLLNFQKIPKIASQLQINKRLGTP